ncbi:MAG: flagellar biosynthesis protein FlhA [Alphaproteobacteria bacterium]|nr:flagellar biosynthesis protein FlhA [Alphaproteobacteria bacterium]
MFAMALVMIMVILILPMPRIIMDMSLAISLTFSVLILMTALFIEKPLEFSSFPTVLLVSTMLRLSLNVASTRLILSNGHEGPQAAGKVIEAFGHFAMGGNFVIGLIVFAILVIVNFVVITKGSGRIAEVSARFSLDAMPGKQMAIDADLSAGIIEEKEAKRRRKELEQESNFFGSMDGAAKFVRGDAIAGLLITFINIISGVIIGVLQNDMDFLDASRTYTVLTVGDGLVSQIPALIVSTAAGMLVSKSGVEGTADKALFSQLSAYPTAVGMSSFLMGTLSLLPGIPMMPFLTLAILTGGGAWYLMQQKDQAAQDIVDDQAAEQKAQDQATAALPPVEVGAAPIDALRIELGYGLLSLLNHERGQRLTEQVKNLRQQLITEIGLMIPSVRLQDNLQLPPNQYVIRIKELEAGKGELRPGQLLVMDPQAQPIQLSGESVLEPSFGLPAMWISELLRSQAELFKYTIIEPSSVLTTHLSEIIKDNISELLTYADVQKLLDGVSDPYKKLLNDIVPGQITVGNIQRILQNLISERVSIRDLPTILEGISEASTFSRNISTITEHVRLRLMRQITFANTDDNGVLIVTSLSPTWEQTFSDTLVGDSDNKQLAMSPSQIQDFIARVRQVYDKMSTLGESPVLVTSAHVRPFVRSILERARPATIILSQNEVHPRAKIKSLGQV